MSERKSNPIIEAAAQAKRERRMTGNLTQTSDGMTKIRVGRHWRPLRALLAASRKEQ